MIYVMFIVLLYVLEYTALVWFSGITHEQNDLLESVQKRVIKILFPLHNYVGALQISKQAKNHFKTMKDPKDKLNCLLPPQQPKNYHFINYYDFSLPHCRTVNY